MYLLIKHIIAFIYLLAGSVSDIKTREVSDWANYGLICVGIAINLIISLYTKNYGYILESLLGFGVFYGLALLMFYTGQWGGGDSKMLMGIGALYGISFQWKYQFLISFVINTLIAGAIYGIFWAIFIAIKNRKSFYKTYRKLMLKKQMKYSRIALIIIIFMGFLAMFFPLFITTKITILAFAAILLLTLHLWALIKAVELSCMHKLVTPDKLIEGDWIAKEVKYAGKVLTGPKDLGIDKKKISLLKRLYKQNKIKKILIKEGIPFVPSFLFGLILTIWVGNILSVF